MTAMQEFSESERLQSLLDLEILDTPNEQEYDQLVQLASQICATPISLVSLVDKERQWFKAAIGLSTKETHRDVSFCSHAIRQPDIFVVEDATLDSRFQSNALVTHEPNIRFYAGIPLRAPNGAALGTLCVIDTKPRTLNEGQRSALNILALQVQARMDLRYKKSQLEKALAENNRLNESLQNSNKLFSGFMDNGPFVSYIKDEKGRFIFYNEPFSEQFGISRQQWLGQTVHDLFPSELADSYRQNDLAALNTAAPQEFAEVSLNPDGVPVHWKSYKFSIRTAEGETLLAGISVDVTEDLNRQQALAKANARLELLATTDSLTGLFNRRVFQGRIEAEFSTALRKDRALSLVVLDIDNFKRRNDEFGHAAGDEVLRTFGAILRDSVRIGDLPVRLGGEEFGILLPDTPSNVAMIVAQRIQSALAQVAVAGPPITASIGIASSSHVSLTWEQLLSQADQAMYQAKRTGKNRIVLRDLLDSQNETLQNQRV